MPWNSPFLWYYFVGSFLISVLYSKSHAVERRYREDAEGEPGEFQSSIQRVMPWNCIRYEYGRSRFEISVLYSKSHAVERGLVVQRNKIALDFSPLFKESCRGTDIRLSDPFSS